MKNLMLILPCLLCFNLFGQIPNYVPVDGLEAWYPFNANANDESGNGHDGTVYGALPAMDRFGNADSAYTFDGVDDYIELTNIITPESFSVAVWALNNDPFGLKQGIVDNFPDWRVVGEDGSVEDPNLNNEGIEFGMTNLAITRFGASLETSMLGDWHHYVATFNADDDSMKLYIDKILVGVDLFVGSRNLTTDSIVIGSKKSLVSSAFFNGEIDDIGIWNRVLSKCEIENLCDASISTGVDVISACDTYTWIDGNTYTASNSTATHTLIDAEGCDSLVTLNLTINTVNTSVTQSGPELTADEPNASYQWLLCPDMTPIVEAIDQSYTASSSGEYAVAVTSNGCVDTSSCYTVTVVSTIEYDLGDAFKIYPNPTDGNYSIELGENDQPVLITITSLSGEVIQSKTYNEGPLLNLKLEEPAGVYLISVESGGRKAIAKLVKE